MQLQTWLREKKGRRFLGESPEVAHSDSEKVSLGSGAFSLGVSAFLGRLELQAGLIFGASGFSSVSRLGLGSRLLLRQLASLG